MTTYMKRLPGGVDLIEALTEFAREKNVTRGTVQVMGALTCGALGYFHQDTREYETFTYEHPMEIASTTGNISLKDGEIFIHLHAVLSDKSCACVGGHVMPGCTIFLAEATITEVPGEPLERVYDEETSLFAWSLE